MVKHRNGQRAPDLAIDWDGTCVTHDYPEVGRDIGAFEWLKKFQQEGCRLILFTMRDGQELKDAVKKARDNGVEFWCLNHNPEQYTWTMSPKVYAQIYVDDNGIGIPLYYPPDGKRPYVKWGIVGPMIMDRIKEWKDKYEQ